MLIITLLNDRSGTNESANYKYTVNVNDSILVRGTVRGHNRSEGWQELIKLLLEQNMKTLICVDCGWIGNETQALKPKHADVRICPKCRGETDEVTKQELPKESELVNK